MPQRFIRFHTRFWPDGISAIGGNISALIGLAGLTGWITGNEFLVSISPRFIAILPLTATAIMLGGIAIRLLEPRFENRSRIPPRIIALLMLLLGVMSLISRVAGEDLFGFGTIFHDSLLTHPYRPLGVMATNSCIVMILVSSALLAMSSRRSELRKFARALALIALSITSLALLGHLYGARPLYTFDQYAGMALLTALGFASLEIGILFLRPADEGISLLTAPDLAGTVMRRMLPLAILFPVLIGVIHLRGREANYFTRETGVALVSVSVSVWMLLLLIYNARFIREADNERGQLLESEQRARAVAETANRAKSDFLAVMSHELRTPLNAIVGYVGIMKERIGGPLTAEQDRNLGRIGESAQHLIKVVNDILTLARIESGKESARHELVFLPNLLDEVGTMVSPLARAKGIAFHCDCDANVSVMSDGHMLKQILINLAGNAVKFTSQGEVRIRSGRQGDRIVVSVSDTGIGIASEHLDRIFEEFWQVEQPLTRSAGGAGLGLTVSRHLAQRLGGTLSVASRPGRGSVFSLAIPASLVATSNVADAQPV